MKVIKNETIPGKAACAHSLKNVLDALYVLNGKWKLPLILSLVQSPKRFKEIQHEITGISSKVLANELKDLELNDFITRNVYPSTPVSIIYEATAYSRTLKNVLAELSAWGEQHREKVKQSMRKQAGVQKQSLIN
ncbi:helix-turn-helix domain-containing protein [Mucilaginibacter sp. OK283]|jgi:DNA-binding HxlR family transcriptional regulator|uniref:winged helix-turn-helix transcriptional regulator n=1 Tax=Mucilaginibacter sp. OK283 TaxID=1881049 RepID=UPI0008BDBEDF|nr:helix-turn-helix domain-containing protein [Mucilaginibacter sp. OK283]SEP37818.1 transcriptional regulator, HxlR family [Mucilaginibacter sp. OK283]